MTRGSGRIEVVEQLRGIAALSVTWFHLTNQYGDWVMSSGNYGWLGVEAFFVISGFVIPLSLAGDWSRFGARAVPGFFLRRLIRIEPPYLLSVLLVVVLNLFAAQFSAFQGHNQSISVGQILWHAAYLIPLTQYEWLQPVYWTLAYEFVFYITVGLAIGIFVSNKKQLLIICYLILLGTIAFNFLSPLLGLFCMGLLVFRARNGLERNGWTALAIGLTGAAMILGGAMAQAVVGTCTAGIICVPSWSRGLPNLAGRILNMLGKVSFSLYLLHVPIGGKIVNLGKRWLIAPDEHFVLSLAALGASLVAAFIFWRLVELPCLKATAAIRSKQRLAKPDSAAE